MATQQHIGELTAIEWNDSKDHWMARYEIPVEGDKPLYIRLPVDDPRSWGALVGGKVTFTITTNEEAP